MSKSLFTNKLLERLEKIDKEAVQKYILQIEEERQDLKELLVDLPIGLMAVEPNQKILWANKIAQSTLGVSFDPNKSTVLSEMIFDADLLHWAEDKMDKQDGILSEEKEVFYPKPRFLILSIKPFYNNEGNVDYFLFVLMDITSIRIKDKELGQLERISSLVKLSQGIAHELGNPLNSILIHLKLLSQKSETLPEKDQNEFNQSIQVLLEETSRMDQIIKNFLKTTRQTPADFELGAINEPIEEAVRFFEPELNEMKIKISLKLDKKLPDFLFDRNKIYQLSVNLIKNAMEAMPKGGSLSVETSFKDQVCSISFADSGVGISEDKVEHIFEEYFTTKEEGSGLGLTIVYSVVLLHGGKIEVKNLNDKGTEFILLLPMRNEKKQLSFNDK